MEKKSEEREKKKKKKKKKKRKHKYLYQKLLFETNAPKSPPHFCVGTVSESFLV